MIGYASLRFLGRHRDRLANGVWLFLAFVCFVVMAELLNQCDRENRPIRDGAKKRWIRVSAGRALDRSISRQAMLADKSPPTLNKLFNSRWEILFVVGLTMGQSDYQLSCQFGNGTEIQSGKFANPLEYRAQAASFERKISARLLRRRSRNSISLHRFRSRMVSVLG